ncbi:unnamed protein product [Lymnaea stagnalis]|uniref:Uncharacterized protein n=1 Tax=Lymnaea stagnalis TaxID=6523 RepID=A0AAV2H4W2_LYMST
MWGKNCHVISPVHTPTTPFYVPTPVGAHTPNVHSVFCGAWHALALLGHPERQPVIDRDEEGNSETDYSSEDRHSVSDSDISRISDTFNSDADYVEKSIPPLGHRTHQVSSNQVSPNQVSSNQVSSNQVSPRNSQNAGTAKRSLPIQGLQSRGHTRLTLAEFYDLSDSSPDRKDGPKHVTSNHRIENSSTTGAGLSLIGQQDDTKVQTVSPKSEKCENGHEGNEPGHYRVRTSLGLSERSSRDSCDPSSAVDNRGNHKASDASESLTSNGAFVPKVKGHESRRDDNTKGRESRHDGRSQEPESISTAQQRKAGDHNEQYRNVSLNPKLVKPLQNNINSDYRREKSKLSSMGARANTMFISTRTSDRYTLPRGSAREKKSSVSLVDINQLQDCVLGNELDKRKSPSFTQNTRLDSVTGSTRLSSASPSVNSEASSSTRRDSALVGKYPRDVSTGSRTKTPRARAKGSYPIQTHFSLQVRGYENPSSGRQDPEVSQPHKNSSPDFTRANLGQTEQFVNLPRSKTVLGKMDRVSRFYPRSFLPSAAGVFKKTLQSTDQSTNVRSLYAHTETFGSQTTINFPLAMTKEPSTTQMTALHTDAPPSQTAVASRVVVYSSASSWRSRPSRDTDSSDDPTPQVPLVMEVPCPRPTLADITGVQTMAIIGCGARTPKPSRDPHRGFSETN